MGRIRYGTSSWSEPSWTGVFYPAGMAAAQQLTHYATQFDTVEADVTYYRVPDRRLVAGWNDKTPEGFLLSAKFPRSVVHGGESERPNAERVLAPEHVAADVDRFLDAMRLLGRKCGPLVLQFPYFNKGAFAGPEPFLARLERFLEALPREFRYAVEVRNKAWIDDALLGVLRRRRAALALVDLAYMPHPADLALQRDLVTTDFVYARLIGDRKAIDALTKRFDRTVVDHGARLARWAELLRNAEPTATEVYVYANNHYAGYAPATVRELARRVRGEPPATDGEAPAGDGATGDALGGDRPPGATFSGDLFDAI
jgi:uncharacterized protein YecE (DUF72 family)